MESQNTRDILIEVKTLIGTIDSRLDTFDKIIVPRTEFMVIVEELRAKHQTNQNDIQSMQKDLRSMMVKLGTALGAMNIITALVMYMISQT